MGIFSETAQWKILSFFFERRGEEIHVKEIARQAKVSPGSASSLCKKLLRTDFLRASRKGNALFYSLNSGNPLAKRLKADWFLEQLLKYRKLWEHEEIQSVALYGSYASGEYGRRSDVDLLIITNMNEAKVLEALRLLQDKLKPEVSFTILPISKWLELGKKKDRFYIEILSNHILLFGSPLVVG